MRAIAISLLLSACFAGEPTPPNDPLIESHIETWDLPGGFIPQIDVLLVVDDTSGFAPYQENLARLPGALESALRVPDGIAADLQIAVVSTDGTGTLRTSSLVDGAFITDRYHFDGSRETNYRGSLADAIASLLPTTATRTSANRPLASMRPALQAFEREYSTVTILTISGGDDISFEAPSVYADAVKGTRTDPARILVSSAFPAGSPRLDAFHQLFPSRSKTDDIATIDYTSSDVVLPLLAFYWGGLVCSEQRPVDVDPQTPGWQYDCSFTALFDETEHVIAPCETGASPCWEFLDESSECWGTGMELAVHGYPGHVWPHIQGECVMR